MEKMMYLLNVDWNWIKQRPQYLAEVLSDYYDVDVFEKIRYRKDNLIHNDASKVNLKKLFILPFQGRSEIIKKLNYLLVKNQLANIIDDYAYIWISNANDYRMIKKHKKQQVVIYDCMDDQIQFPSIKNNKLLRDLYIQNEYELIMDSYCVFASAEHLKDVLLKRYSDVDEKKIIVLNNAVTKKMLDTKYKHIISEDKRSNKIITYIGTVAEWIDWDIVIKSLNLFDNIEYHFYGPKECDIPNHDRLLYKGIIPQQDIYRVMKTSNLLIMPFIINDLIVSVNPVKLYEYILSEVPSLACAYTETEKFRDYVYLYHDENEFFDVMRKLSDGSLINKSKDGYGFVKNNTWESRGKMIFSILNKREL